MAAPAPRAGWVSRRARVAGLRVHVRMRAEPVAGLPVVLVHGLAVSHRYLMPTATALADRFPVMVPDLPGFGFTDKPRHAYSVSEHADFLATWLDAHRLSGVCLAGHSFGAEVVAAVSRSRPELVGALVLASPTTDPAARTRARLTGRWFSDLPVEDPRQAAILARDVGQAGLWRVWSTVGHSVHNAVEDDLARVAAPTLVLGGNKDPVAPLAWRTRVAQLTGGTSVTIPGAAHNMLTTHGEAAAGAIAVLLDQVTGDRSSVTANG